VRHPILEIAEVSPEVYEVSDLRLEGLSRRTLWLFDLEATGLDTDRERVTQIAGIAMRGGEPIEASAFEQYVALPEGFALSKEVQELTGISAQTLEGAPPFRDAWARHLEAAAGADLWIGQSVFEFDVPLLFAEFARHRLPAELPAVLDSVVIATHLLGPPPPGERWSTSKLLARFAVDTSGLRRHDALHDVKILARILAPMLRQLRDERGDCLDIPRGKPSAARADPALSPTARAARCSRPGARTRRRDSGRGTARDRRRNAPPRRAAR
jgi:DNA polymerase III alpha subunit (gram-positive type)